MNLLMIFKLGHVMVGLVELAVSCRLASLFLSEKECVPKWQKILSFILVAFCLGFMVIFVGPSPLTAFSVLGSFLIYHFVCYEGSLSKRIIVIALCGIIVAMSDFFSLMTFNKYRLGYPPASLAFETYWTLMGVGSKVICFMIINTIYRVVQYKKHGFKPVELILHVSPIITLYIIELLMQSIIGTPYLQGGNAFTAVLTSMGLLFTNVFTWSVFDALIKNEREKQFYLMCQESVKQQYEFYRNQEAKEESTRRIWHDIHNHLQCVHDLIRQGHSAEAHDYLVSLEKDISMLRGEIRTGHLIVDTILADKYGAALAYQIKMAMKVNGNLLNAIQDMDLCVIYSNLIDNAIEACQKNSLDEREILITTKKANHYTLIEVINSRSGDLIKQNGEFITTKQSPTGHGIGLSNVRQVVSKYDGDIMVSYTDTTFKVQIFIPLTTSI